MQLINEPQKDEHAKSKKIVLTSLIITIILFFILLIVSGVLTVTQPKELKFSIDGATKTIPENLFVTQENELYISLKDIANLIGYEYYNGEYQKYTENEENCYLESENEVVSLELNSKDINKAVEIGSTDYYTYKMESPIIQLNNRLYISSSGLMKACNIKISYDTEENDIKMYTIKYLSDNYKQVAINQYKYTGVSEEFYNQKTILEDMLIIEKDKKYGVISLKDGETIIGTKYDDIEYIEVSEEFLVKSSNKVGILSKDGDIKINLDYSEIKILDKDSKLYYVENTNNLKGVINGNGKIVIYAEYDEIGVDTSLYVSNNIKNSMLLFDNCIPVKKNDKWGLYDVNGNVLQNTIWDSLGYIGTTSKNKMDTNTLIIPSLQGIEGIVVCRDNKYGIINSTGKAIAPAQFDKIYYQVSNGVETYYMEYQGQTVKLKDYLENAGYVPKNDKEQTENENKVQTQNNVSVNNSSNETKSTNKNS